MLEIKAETDMRSSLNKVSFHRWLNVGCKGGIEYGEERKAKNYRIRL